MIPFRHFILPKIHCGIARGTKIEEKIEVASDLDHAETEHGIDADQLVAHIEQQRKSVPPVPTTKWYEHDAKPIKDEHLYTPDRQDLHDKLVGHYKDFTPAHKSIIKQYASAQGDHDQAFRYVNSRIIHDDLHPHDAVRMQSMDDALKAHRTAEPMHVFSGVGRDHAQDVLTAEKVHHPSYLSTSIMPGTAMSFAADHTSPDDNHKVSHAHILKIHVPAGHHGAYVDHFGGIQGENEFILPRDTVLHIDHSKREVYEKNYGHFTRKTFIHHATPVTE